MPPEFARNQSFRKPSRMLIKVFFAALLVCPVAFAQTPSAAPPAFEVVSIRPDPASVSLRGWKTTPDGFHMNQSIWAAIMEAYFPQGRDHWYAAWSTNPSGFAMDTPSTHESQKQIARHGRSRAQPWSRNRCCARCCRPCWPSDASSPSTGSQAPSQASLSLSINAARASQSRLLAQSSPRE
jgi:hypothetical protein